MNDSEAAERTRGGEAAMRQGLVELARQFLAEGLVVRTWGNFSARLDRDYFLVTPSGRSYETLQPADLVKCRIDSGDKVESEEQKPSSEAPMHALVYRERPAFNVLAHTHQVYASALSLSESPVLLDETGRKQLGADSVPVSPYGLPGTRRLHRHIAETLMETEASCLLMASHGAFIFGESGGDCLSRAWGAAITDALPSRTAQRKKGKPYLLRVAAGFLPLLSRATQNCSSCSVRP